MSVDSQSSHQRYAEGKGYPFLLLADEGGQVAEAYDVKGLLGKNQRTVVLVDKSGVIQYYKRGMPADSDILAAIDVLSPVGA